MLEYLLIRPNDSPLFDGDRGAHWRSIVLDEAHQYRGAKGMEMGMLIRRLKQRLRDGGRQDPFRCIATSATLSSGESEEDKQVVGEFAAELFGDPFSTDGIVFGKSQPVDDDRPPRRYHAFLRALEGAFLVHRGGADAVVLNRKSESGNGLNSEPMEISLCRECGQHYYVGRERDGKLKEAVRDPSQPDFGVDYYLPVENGDELLCRSCCALSKSTPACDCGAAVRVKKCESHQDHADQLRRCETCGYQRGGIGDPVQEIVHGSDGPNAVIATALHERFQRDMQAPLTGFMPESSRTPRSDPGSPEEVGGFCPATISSAPLGTPQVTPNDTQRHFSARIWAFWAPGHCAIQPVRTVPKHLSSQTCLRVRGSIDQARPNRRWSQSHVMELRAWLQRVQPERSGRSELERPPGGVPPHLRVPRHSTPLNAS